MVDQRAALRDVGLDFMGGGSGRDVHRRGTVRRSVVVDRVVRQNM